jgi:quercetin dioxygenase-like cupin family protein
MIMRWTRIAAVAGAVISAGGFALASRGEHGEGKVKVLSERDIAETVNGRQARVTMVEVAFEPGDAGQPHRHAGPVFGYVLEGEFELGLGEDAEGRGDVL